MYFKYSWLAGTTPAQALADIVSVICSSVPNSSNLSSSCDKPFSTLLANTVPSNWTVYDAAAAVNSQVLRSLNADGTTYKYVQLLTTTASISLIGWESWNATTHVGLNGSSNSGSANIQNYVSGTTFLSPGNISIVATSRFLTLINSPLINSGNAYLLEISRDGILLDSTYPCIVTGISSSQFVRTANTSIANLSLCRVKNINAAGDNVGTAIGSAVMLLNVLSNTGSSYSQGSGYLGIDNQAHLLTLPIMLGYGPISGTNLGNLGTVQGGILVIPCTSLVFNNLDELVINDITYILIISGNQNILAIPKA